MRKVFLCIMLKLVLLTGCDEGDSNDSSISVPEEKIDIIDDDTDVEEEETQTKLFDNMVSLESYHVELIVTSNSLVQMNKTDIYYNNYVWLVWDYGEEIAYQIVDDSLYSILWIGQDYYGFEVQEDDYLYV